MKNIIILLGVFLYITSIFLPWGPTGSNLETGFNEEGSPGILGIISAIICLIFAVKTSRKSYLRTLVIGVLMALLPLGLISRILTLSGNDFMSIKFGVYLLLAGAFIVIYGALRARKQLSTENASIQG